MSIAKRCDFDAILTPRMLPSALQRSCSLGHLAGCVCPGCSPVLKTVMRHQGRDEATVWVWVRRGGGEGRRQGESEGDRSRERVRGAGGAAVKSQICVCVLVRMAVLAHARGARVQVPALACHEGCVRWSTDDASIYSVCVCAVCISSGRGVSRGWRSTSGPKRFRTMSWVRYANLGGWSDVEDSMERRLREQAGGGKWLVETTNVSDTSVCYMYHCPFKWKHQCSLTFRVRGNVHLGQHG